jgi:thymidylate synthase
MYIEAETVDDLMHEILTVLLDRTNIVKASRGNTKEIFGALLHLRNPRARLSKTETKGTPFSALGELLWYLSGSDKLDFIEHYISEYQNETEDGETICGAYGPRLMNFRGKYNQIDNIINLLKEKPTTRRAVIQIFDAKDVALDIEKKLKEIPCTCTLQFSIRGGKLDMITSMRSNDAYWGLPHDIFTFTMLQEIIALSLNVDLGVYKHSVGSLHIYKDKEKYAKYYLEEGYQSIEEASMPIMPKGNPWSAIGALLNIEEKIRCDGAKNITIDKLGTYWTDLALLLKVHYYYKNDEFDAIKNLKQNVSADIYNIYIDQKIKRSYNKK